MTPRQPKTTAMLCLAFLLSSFYIFVRVLVFGLRLPGCMENEDPTGSSFSAHPPVNNNDKRKYCKNNRDLTTEIKQKSKGPLARQNYGKYCKSRKDFVC